MFDRILAILLKLLPPIGPLKALQLKVPTPKVEALFEESFSRAAVQFHGQLDDVSIQRVQLQNTNYDVGTVTPAGTYRLADEIHAFWLNLLAEKKFGTVTPAIKTEIATYYRDLNAPIETKKHRKKWRLLLAQLEAIKQMKPGS